MLEVGAAAPPFRGKDQHGREIDLTALIERGPLVLYFYSRDFTPICTREACAFRDAYEELRELGAQVVGVSADDEDTHRRFAAAHQIPFSLVVDSGRAIQRSFDAFRLFGLFNQRATFVIDRAGVVRAAISHEMLARRHAQEVRAVLLELRRTG